MVDPLSTGGNVALEAKNRGYAVIACWCSELTEDFRSHVSEAAKGLEYLAEVEEKATYAETAAAIKEAAGDMPIAACIVGGESGVTLADHLSAELGVRTNGIFAGGDRRNKSVQQKAVKAAGLRAVREALGTKWEQVKDFVAKEPMPVVVKPVESCGSDGVKLCKSVEEAEAHFNLLMEGQQRVGAQGAAVLCQQFLKGKEYVVDHVSRDGVHKCVMVWVYDKRPTNGSAFVYYGMIPVDAKSEVAKILIEYTVGVLDALKLDNGPTHGEVMMTADGPCLVEMNCRSHGWDGAWVPLARALTGGYAQPEVAVDSHTDAAAFEKLPVVYPSPFKAAGQSVMLVSFFAGTVRSTPGYDKMKKMSSFVALQTGITVGSKVELTVDLFTAVGVLILANTDKVQLEADLAEVRKMEQEGLFGLDEEVDPLQFEPIPDMIIQAGRHRSMTIGSVGSESTMGRRRSMTIGSVGDEATESSAKELSSPTHAGKSGAGQVLIMVDPLSTGGNVALEAKNRGYAVIACWCSELTEDFRSHVSEAAKGLEYLAEVEEKATYAETAAAIKEAAGDMPIAACIVGGESGVTLADHLSAELGVRTNGIFAGGDRRNKSVQQKAVKAAGLRAVREALGTKWEQVKDFVAKEPMPVVVKPVESCGSDGVKLCKSVEEAEAHFNLLMEGQQRVGAQGAAVLCQQFLKGKEYVVDHVSRDGVHKCVMVWVYDKRPTNGSAFVYYGMIPVDAKSEVAKILIEYTVGVLDALKLDNGPTHGEVMMTADGPCLVEMNCRSHGWDGAWVPLARALTGGYAQPEVAVDSHTDAAAFEKLPVVYPSPFKAAGQSVMLVSFFAGTVRSTPGYDKMKKMSSFVALQTGITVGSKVELTVDLFTAVGVLILANTDKVQLEADLAEVRKMEQEGLFGFDEACDYLYETNKDSITMVGRRRSSFDETLP